ncbi:NAD(P)-dependent oxidoreductase [Thauera sinica]|uniref:NAD(P)-dependent oxidoreductase n=1 Tax=Thauera sinica TaxID=2665146 RepID=A0ABW1AV11_9RHOO|nr:NAD(P)H-binding protein [Thauera sp. K11]ATE62466.1 NAD-dependent epimerase [Thauera sp. K11]
MAKIIVIGGNGYAGSHIVREAAARGHEVVSLGRSQPAEPVPGVRHETGSAADLETLERVIAGADVVVGALSPFQPGLAAQFIPIYRAALAPIARAGARFVVIGGFSGLRPAPGAPRFIDSGDVPPEFLDGARATHDAFDLLQAEAPQALDWLFVSPGAQFGAFAPGERRGIYRKSGDVALFDAEGKSAIGGADFALAVVDEIESPTLRRGQIHFAY